FILFLMLQRLSHSLKLECIEFFFHRLLQHEQLSFSTRSTQRHECCHAMAEGIAAAVLGAVVGRVSSSASISRSCSGKPRSVWLARQLLPSWSRSTPRPSNDPEAGSHLRMRFFKG